MKLFTVLFSALFAVPSFSEGPHTTSGLSTSSDIKAERGSAIELQIARAEIRTEELNLELSKLKKLREGNRSESQINADIARQSQYIDSKRREKELLGKLRYDSCYAEFELKERREPVTDPDSGFTTGSQTVLYLRCSPLTDICNKGNRPYGIAKSIGEGRSEIWIKDKNDTRIGKECDCMCMSDDFANTFFR